MGMGWQVRDGTRGRLRMDSEFAGTNGDGDEYNTSPCWAVQLSIVNYTAWDIFGLD